MRRGTNRRAPSYATFLLFSQLFQEFNDRGIPPVTLSAILGQTIIYFRALPIPWDSSLASACLSANKIFYYKDYWKILISQLEHADDWHLYYNMISFMVKGQHLEKRMGSVKYAILLALFTLSTGFTYVGLNYALSEVLEDSSYMHHCAVGFSGVIFALKVLTTHDLTHSGRPMSMMGIHFGTSLSAKYAVWIELILISLVSPSASFVGHLAGILVGLAYVHGPLKVILDSIDGL